ncbi:MAG: hypothetical protein NDJ94_10415 [Vicinamibacteria bacterium]|jgi:hypothetical protein|nr:hypothetical protein [Vicinamibacteria bacterium]
MNTPASAALLRRLLWINIGVHVAALAFAALGMRPGTPAMPLAERMAFLATAPLGWTLGWGLWTGCAMANLAFIAALASRAPRTAPLAELAVPLAVAGAAVDLIWDTVHIVVLPLLAAQGPDAAGTFLAVERMAWAVGAIVANGFYSTATLLVTLSLAAAGLIPERARLLGIATFALGMLMCVAGFTGVPFHLEAVSGPTILVFCAWNYAAGEAFARGSVDEADRA